MKSVLITRFSALGDVAMTIPVVYCVARSNPDVRFLFATRPLPATLFVGRPENLDVVGIDLDRYKGVGGMRRLASRLRREHKIDAVADLHDVLRTKLLRIFMRLSGVKTAHIHKGRADKRRLTRSRNKVMLPVTSTRARYREVFWRLGLARQDDFTTVFAGTRPDPDAYAAASAPRSEGETWVAVAPFGGHPGKIYPLHLMEKVVEELAARPGYKIFLFGAGAEENSVLAQWRARFGHHVVNMAALRLGLPAELALLSACSVMLSMDSANMHLASLVGLRVVSMWGATHPYCGFMGWHQRREDAVQLDMMCRPCSVYGARPCARGDYHCMAGISPSLVVSHIDRVLTE